MDAEQEQVKPGTKNMKACVAFLFVCGLIGCASSRVPLTPDLAAQLSDEEVRNLQFYVSKRIVLRRDLSTSGKSVTPGHRVLIESGRQIEEVVVSKGVPGVATERGKSSICVSFEPPVDNQEFFLMFEGGIEGYVLRKSFVTYGREEFQVTEGQNRATLEIDADVVNRVESRRRQAPGRVLESSTPR